MIREAYEILRDAFAISFFAVVLLLLAALLSAARAETVSLPSGCPATRFCGCGVSVRVFGHSVRSLWPSQAWRKFPRATPAPGRVAIWGHHVAYIETVDANGNAV